jgi:general secretion pathway protein N
MRIRLPMRRAVLFAILFVLALLVLLPLRLVIGGSGLSAREASGTIWSGTLKEARVGPAVLGDLDVRVAPLPLLTGRLQLDLSRPGAAPDRLSGSLVLSRNRRAIERATGLVPIEASIGALPLASLDLTDVTARFRDGICDRAEGIVRANLSASATGSNLPASLSGTARCDRGAVLVPFALGGTGGRVELRIHGDGRYDVSAPRE